MEIFISTVTPKVIAGKILFRGDTLNHRVRKAYCEKLSVDKPGECGFGFMNFEITGVECTGFMKS